MGFVLLLAGATALAVAARAQTAAPSKPAHKPAAPPAKKRAVANAGARRTKRVTPTKGRRRRKETFKVRLARLKLQPERVTEIQRALAQTGYLNQEPTGKWDEPTRSAMRRYQEANGFPSTGLPEAKSIMKLGLGPHPLPEELDSTAQAGAATASQPESGSSASSPTQQR